MRDRAKNLTQFEAWVGITRDTVAAVLRLFLRSGEEAAFWIGGGGLF